MSQPIPLESRPLNYWRLRFSIAEAAADCREAPWYGPWSIAVQQLFENFCPRHGPFVTITYPQYPVTKDIDSIIPDEDEDSGEGEDEDDSDSDDGVCHIALSSISAKVIHRWHLHRRELRRVPKFTKVFVRICQRLPQN